MAWLSLPRPDATQVEGEQTDQAGGIRQPKCAAARQMPGARRTCNGSGNRHRVSLGRRFVTRRRHVQRLGVSALGSFVRVARAAHPGRGRQGAWELDLDDAWPGWTSVFSPAERPWRIPDFVDCTGENYSDWAHFRSIFRRNFAAGSPPDEAVFNEARRLHVRHKDKLAVANEDYPWGAARFYHSCHFEEPSQYCLYGHLAALYYLALYATSEAVQEFFTYQALRLLHWNYCLDFLESSTWGISAESFLGRAQRHIYPQVTELHQHLEIGPGTLGTPGGDAARKAGDGVDPEPAVFVFELGTHAALSREPLSLWQRFILREDRPLVHQNFVEPYKGGAEAFQHPFPQSCSPNCPDQQESVPYIFPIMAEAEAFEEGLGRWFRDHWFAKPFVRESAIFLCTNPILFCRFFRQFGRPVLGYFGLPLHYMVPKHDWGHWLEAFFGMALDIRNTFVTNNFMLAEQIAWQTGIRLPTLSPSCVYLNTSYNPTRTHEVLVPEPREACVLHCLLRHFLRDVESYPFHFLRKADTDRQFSTFASFRAVVLFPHDVALMIFYEFYALGVPLFVPEHPSKYIFPYSASVPLLDHVPMWRRERRWPHPVPRAAGERNADRASLVGLRYFRDPGPGGGPRRAVVEDDTGNGDTVAPYSPLALTSEGALVHWQRYMDFFRFPGVQRFRHIPHLLEELPAANFQALSTRMRRHWEDRLVENVHFWREALNEALTQVHDRAE